MPVEKIPSTINEDVIETLKALLAGAQRGEVTGVAFAAALRSRRYITNATGSCLESPTYTRGMVATLYDELGRIVLRRDPSDTR